MDLSPCFQAGENNFPIWKPLQIIHSFDNWYSATDAILSGKFYQPPTVTLRCSKGYISVQTYSSVIIQMQFGFTVS